MSKKFKVGIDLKCNIKNDCELFYLNDFKDYDFYNKFSAGDAVRTRAYNVLAGKQNALANEEFGNTWNDINREIFRYISLFTHRVYNQEHDDIKLEFDDLDMQPLSVNTELISALRPATIVFNADVVAELTCRVECADSDKWEDCAKFINKCADKLAGNAYESSVYNNYIFSLEDCEVDVEFADAPSEPDYDGDDYVSVRYVPLNI